MTVKAVDEYGAESTLGSLSIRMPKTLELDMPFLQLFLERIIERFPLLENILTSIFT